MSVPAAARRAARVTEPRLTSTYLPDFCQPPGVLAVVLYGVSVARALEHGFEFVGEINGRVNTRDDSVPTGTETRSMIRVGARMTRSAVRVDGGLIFGLTSNDPSFGFTAGVTYVFKGFTLP